MALHRDIYWVGRQWAVTGYGVQACDQKQKSKFDIEASQLWEDDALENLRAQKWLNIEDFDKALDIARKRFAEPARKIAPSSDAIVLPVRESRPAAPPPAPKPEVPKAQKLDPKPAREIKEIRQLKKPETPKLETAAPPKPAVPTFQMRIIGSAKFLRSWRVRPRQ